MTINDAAEMEKLLGMWINGVPTGGAAPAAWRAALESLPEPEVELRLLVLTGQALQLAAVPCPEKKLSLKGRLPTLDLPPLPERARGLFRRLFSHIGDAESRARVLHLMAARGRTAHPFDWLPSGVHSGLPQVYAPWLAWLNDSVTVSSASPLTAETWDAFYPAERVEALKSMRHQNPEGVLEIFAAKFADEAAETRVKLMSVFEVNPGAQDQAFLESLEKDRSGKVKRVARQLLARLGGRAAASGDLAELADFFSKAKGGKWLLPAPTKNNTQRQRRAQLILEADFGSLATQLGYEPAALIDAWRFGEDPSLDLALSAMIGHSASDALLEQWVGRVAAKGDRFEEVLAPLRERVNPAQRRQIAERGLARSLPLPCVVSWAEEELGTFSEKTLRSSGAWKDLLGDIRKEMQSGTVKGRGIAAELFDLALLADAEAARTLLDKITGLGLTAYDPRLLLLQLNTQLSPETPPGT